MKKNNTIRLTESEFKSLIKESVKQVLNCNLKNCSLIKEEIIHKSDNEFILLAYDIDYSDNPKLKQFFDNAPEGIEDFMDVDIISYYETYEGRPGNYATYEEPIPASYEIYDYDYKINQELKNFMDDDIYNEFNKYIDDYISSNLDEMVNYFENSDPEGIFY
jgi:hypothetical protein